jgi:hypothetical protein
MKAFLRIKPNGDGRSRIDSCGEFLELDRGMRREDREKAEGIHQARRKRDMYEARLFRNSRYSSKTIPVSTGLNVFGRASEKVYD